MIVKKIWKEYDEDNMLQYGCTGWYLLGVIPLFIIRIKL